MFRNGRRVHRFILCRSYMMFPLVLYPLFWGCVLPYLRSPKGGCCSISDDLSCYFFWWSNHFKWNKNVSVFYFFGCTCCVHTAMCVIGWKYSSFSYMFVLLINKTINIISFIKLCFIHIFIFICCTLYNIIHTKPFHSLFYMCFTLRSADLRLECYSIPLYLFIYLRMSSTWRTRGFPSLLVSPLIAQWSLLVLAYSRFDLLFFLSFAIVYIRKDAIINFNETLTIFRDTLWFKPGRWLERHLIQCIGAEGPQCDYCLEFKALFHRKGR